MQEVVALLNELCVRFPIVAAHNSAALFALAQPEAPFANAAAAATAAACPVALYHLSTGVQSHQLVLDSSGGARRGGGQKGGPGPASPRRVNPIAPMAVLPVRQLSPTLCAQH